MPLLYKEDLTYANADSNIDGFMRPNELQWLYDQATQYKTIVEVGSWKGRSTHALLSGSVRKKRRNKPDGTVYAVDHFNGSVGEENARHKDVNEMDISEQFHKHVGGFHNLVTIIGNDKNAIELFADKSVDMVFLDGDHRYEVVMEDLKAWKKKCKHLLCGHDANYDSVKKALIDSGIEYTCPINGIWAVYL